MEAAETHLESQQTPVADLGTTGARVAAGIHPGTHGVQHGPSDGRLASGISLEEPLFRDLLAQPATDLQFIDEASFADTDLGFPWFNVDI